MGKMNNSKCYLNNLILFAIRNFDEVTILSVLSKIAFEHQFGLDEKDQIVLEAFKRFNPDFVNSDISQISEYLRSLNWEQISGLSNNIKGITHELIYADWVNENYDNLTAVLFDETNHPDTDIIIYDDDTNERWEVQLKATDNESDILNWINDHPDGEIIITEELAEKMDLKSSHISNDKLSADVDEVIDKLISDSNLADKIPWITVASISIVIYGLYKRYRKGEISKKKFISISARAAGLKVGKLVTICALLSIPIVGPIVGMGLIAKMIMSGRSIVAKYEDRSLF